MTVHREISPWDAHIIAGRLRAEGLHPSLMAEHHASVYWVISMALGEVRIQVPLAEAASARQALADWRAGLYQQALEDELDLSRTARCPQCQHGDWTLVRDIGSRLLACVMCFFGAPTFRLESLGSDAGLVVMWNATTA